MENGQAIGEFGTFLESGNHTTEMTNKTFTLLSSLQQQVVCWSKDGPHSNNELAAGVRTVLAPTTTGLQEQGRTSE